jgi:predicted transcriptional regulator
MNTKIRRLPDSELEVMQVLWELDAPATRSEVEAVLKDRHPMAQTTLLTLLSRLAKKGFVSIEKKRAGQRLCPAGGEAGLSCSSKQPVL